MKHIALASLLAFLTTESLAFAGESACTAVYACGDVDGSGKVLSSDALRVLKVAVSIPQTLTCDCDDGGAASTCQTNLGICQGDVASCGSNLESCQSDLAACSAGCDAPFACPVPTDANHQTICGQLFDLEDGSKFQATDAAGVECTTPTDDGPCSLNVLAYDALAFASNPATAAPLASGPVYIDDCGRYRLPDIAIPSGPFIELEIDDAEQAKRGPTGSTNTVGVTAPKQAGTATPNFDGWVASDATTDMWENSGGPPVSGGLYIPIFYEKVARTNSDLQDGVTLTKSGNPVPLQDDYFVATESARHTIDPAATATGINGTVLVTGASVNDGVVYSGSGGDLSSNCQWEKHAGASLPFILSVQGFRPQDAIGQTCDR